MESERLATADALGKRREEFMKLKVEGMLECGELLVIALMDGRERHIFGRRTLAGDGPRVGGVRDPEHVARRARRRSRHGLGVAVRRRRGSRAAAHARGRAARGDSVPRPRRTVLQRADAGDRALGEPPAARRLCVRKPLAGSRQRRRNSARVTVAAASPRSPSARRSPCPAGVSRARSAARRTETSRARFSRAAASHAAGRRRDRR